MCTSVAQDEMATVLACYSDLPTDGMYASFNGSGAAHFAGVGLRTSPKPKVFDMRVLAGRTECTSSTRRTSRSPPTTSATSGGVVPALPVRRDEGEGGGVGAVLCRRAATPDRMDAQWVRVTVNSKDFIHLIGSVTGTWSLFLAAGALIYHLLTRRRKVVEDDGVRMRVEVDTWRGERAGAHSTRAERSVGHGGALDAGRARDRACGTGRCRGRGRRGRC